MLKNALQHKAETADAKDWKQVSQSGTFSQLHSIFEHSNIGYGFYCFSNQSSKNIKVSVTLTQQESIKVCKENGQMISFFSLLENASNLISVPGKLTKPAGLDSSRFVHSCEEHQHRILGYFQRRVQDIVQDQHEHILTII